MWEYYNCNIISPGINAASHDAHMARLGDDGWEMCGCFFSGDSYRMFFKRPKQLKSGQPYR